MFKVALTAKTIIEVNPGMPDAWKGNFDTWAAANRDGIEEDVMADIVDALEWTGIYGGGGGAAAEYVIVRR